jgi:hypothetical protein
VKTQLKVTIYEAESRLSEDTASSGALILNYGTSRVGRNKFPLFISYSVYGNLL